MKKVLVLGASGGMGYALVMELASRGIEVIAFARNKEKLDELFGHMSLVTTVSGDIFIIESLMKAATGVDSIFHAANIPYSQWHVKLRQLVSNIIKVSEAQSTKLIFADSIYSYGRKPNELVREDSPKYPHTVKGKLRLENEQLIKQSTVPTLIAHFPDFYGPHASNTLLHFTLNPVAKNKKTRFIGDPTIAREFIYTPDGAKALVNLALTEKAYHQNWNIPAYDVITGEEIIKILREELNYEKKVSIVTKGMIQFLGLFSKNMREVVEMFYLNEEPVILSGEKYEAEIGRLPKTPYKDGIIATINQIKQQQI
ncbi:SDR family NAD(P)-dependent oxidoreductase [Metabacillus malikii]|uniref:Nucleoside-diphosphate-sugar epimerase n=1 Tax=Metabacillus malikii TaxID=1504265 RepID=A0ABT9ZBH8_9BACI|nr:SDR family NAD(P)-dependent oxidoreductase [Metabacillus malikii]MDQ0229264.1 nucleoside-diphosphate-sugar epimerase [Metabacillus malikii]